MFLWRTLDNYLSIITKYPLYLFYCAYLLCKQLPDLFVCFITFYIKTNAMQLWSSGHEILQPIYSRKTGLLNLCCFLTFYINTSSSFMTDRVVSPSGTEPHRDTTTKWHVRPAKIRVSLDIHPVWLGSSLCTYWVAKNPSFLQATAKTLLSLGGCAGWSESLLGAHAILLVFVMMRLISSYMVGFEVGETWGLSAQSLGYHPFVVLNTQQCSIIGWVSALGAGEWQVQIPTVTYNHY